jgi:hypothetical protein
VLIDAASVDAITRGDYRLVIGELHLANTLLQPAFVSQHPNGRQLFDALDREDPRPRVHTVGPRDTAPYRVRIMPRPQDVGHLACSDPSPFAPAQTLRTADLVVVEAGGRLVVRSRAHGPDMDMECLEFFSFLIMWKNINSLSMIGPAAHRPRIAIDGVVVCREQWQFSARDLTFAAIGDDLARFVDCHRWAHGHGIPPLVFVKMPGERKPTYVDLTSPLFVDLFARFVRRQCQIDASATVAVTEMLPTPDGAWLTDATGRRYTSELRIVAVAPAA